MTIASVFEEPPAAQGWAAMEAKAGEAAALLGAMSHPKRLMLLCHIGAGEMSVGEINARVALSQSALSQHLARLRRDGMVATRRRGATILYRISHPGVAAVIAALKTTYCPE